jgi:hypothetical protein
MFNFFQFISQSCLCTLLNNKKNSCLL